MSEAFKRHTFFKLGFIPCKAEEPLQGMEFKAHRAKIKAHRKSV